MADYHSIGLQIAKELICTDRQWYLLIPSISLSLSFILMIPLVSIGTERDMFHIRDWESSMRHLQMPRKQYGSLSLLQCTFLSSSLSVWVGKARSSFRSESWRSRNDPFPF